MYQRTESYFAGHDGIKLYRQHWGCENPQVSVIITHGQGEHSDSYQRVVDYFKGQQIQFFAWDMRGHGRSEGKRGYVGSFKDYIEDFHIYLNILKSHISGPCFLLSHSMGGLVQLRTLSLNPELQDLYRGFIFSAPLWGLAVKVPAWKNYGSVLIQKTLPELTLYNEMKNEFLTRDPDVIKEFEQDPLRHTRISSGAYLGFLENFEFVKEDAKNIHKPTLLQISDQDPVVSTPSAKEVFSLISDNKKECYFYGGAKHEIYNDLCRVSAFEDLKKFIHTHRGF